MNTISGRILKVIYYNNDTGYSIVAIKLKDSIKPNELKKFENATTLSTLKKELTVVGVFDRSPVEDEEYSFNGSLDLNPKYGIQFKFTSFSRFSTSSKSGVVSYLSSDLFEGIGTMKASLVYEKLGGNALKLIAEDPTVLDSLDLSPTEKSVITDGVKQDLQNQETTLFLLEHGLSMTYIHKILEELKGLDIISIIKKNPYILMDKIDRFGFKKADALAEKLGISKDSECRVIALITTTVMDYIYSTGNSYLYEEELYTNLIKESGAIVPVQIFKDMLKDLVKNRKLYVDQEERVFLYNLYYDEVDLADEVRLFIDGRRSLTKKMKTYSKKSIDNHFKEMTSSLDFSYSPLQAEAIKMAFTEPIVIITGGPGTGKTTIIHGIIDMYLRLNNNSKGLINKIALVAPTGRAAKRLGESTNMEAMTIHRYLKASPSTGFEYNRYNRTSSRLVIVDEASMMDTSLATSLLTSLDPLARLIIVGDVDQLPSVGPGQVLKDLIDSNKVRSIRLQKIHRQDKDSSIITLAHDVNEGRVPCDILSKYQDRSFIVTSKEALAKLTVDLYMKALEKGKTIRDVQILLPMYKGTSGITAINLMIQERLASFTNDEERYKDILKLPFKLNDKVIQTVNRTEKGVMNGDIGYISNFVVDENGKLQGVNVAFDIIKVYYELNEIDDLSLAYAISIHKSQGSEFDTVILPFTSSHMIMLKRKLIYTAITRAKKHLIMIGDAFALQNGIEDIESPRRTILKERLLFESKTSSTDIIKNTLASIDNEEVKKIEEEKYILDKELSKTKEIIKKTNVDTNDFTLGEVETEVSKDDFND